MPSRIPTAPSRIPTAPSRLPTAPSRIPTAPLAATGLVAGYGVAVATGSRPLGGVVLAAFGLGCLSVWARRDPRRVTVSLTVAGLGGFAISHVLARAIGAWPSVLAMSAVVAALCWGLSDRHHLRWRGRALPARRLA